MDATLPTILAIALLCLCFIAVAMCSPRTKAPRDFQTRRHRRSGGRAKPDWVVREVMTLLAEPGASLRGVATEFNRRHAHASVTISHGTVKNWQRKHSALMRRVQVATRNRWPHPLPANARWGLDCTGKADAAGVQHCILGIIDHGTRVACALRRIRRPSAWLILSHVFAAIDEFGKPQAMRTDNAPVFRSALFRAAMEIAGIRHEFSGLGKPWQNGRIERLFLTLKQKLDFVSPIDGPSLERMLREFSYWYNQVRPHQHLHGHTPVEVWCGIDVYSRKPRRIELFEGWGGMLRGYVMRR